MATQTTPPPGADKTGQHKRPDNRFFTWMRSLGIVREPGWIGGVSAGIATRLGIDPLIVRGVLVVVAVLGGPALLLYAAAWLLLPDTDDRIHLEQLIKGNLESPIAGIGVLVLLSLLPVTQGFWFAGSAFWGEPFWGAAFGRALWTLILLGLVVWLVVWIARRADRPTDATPRPKTTPPPAASASKEEFSAWREQQAAVRAETIAFRHHADARRSAESREAHEQQMLEIARLRAIRQEERRLTRSNPLFSVLVIGLALVAGGMTTLSLKKGEIEVTTVVAGLAVALAVLALGILVNGLRGKRAGGSAGVAAIIVLPLFFFTLWPQTDNFQYGAAYFAPTQQPTGRPEVYAALTGPVVLDLEDFYEDSRSDSRSTENVYLLVGSADVTVILPDTHVSVETVAGLGSVQVWHGEDDYEDWSKNSLITFEGEDSTPGRLLTVHIYGAGGNITINDPEASK